MREEEVEGGWKAIPGDGRSVQHITTALFYLPEPMGRIEGGYTT